MARVISKLSIQVSANSATLRRDFGQLQRESQRAAAGINSAGRSTAKYADQARGASSATKGLAAQAAAAAAKFASLAAVVGGLSLVASLTAGAETTATQFKVLLGDAEKAQAVIAELRAYTASTPFAEGDVNRSAQTLLGYETSPEELMQQLQMLGDIAAGSGANLNDLARIFGRVQQAGVASLEEINQLGDRQIPILTALREVTGKNREEMKKWISDGNVGFTEMQAAMESLTAAGGVYFNATAELSETLAGKISTLKDNVRALAISVGEKMLPLLKAFADAALAAAEGIKNLNAGTVQTVTRIAAFIGAFAAGVAAAGLFIATAAKIVAAMKSIAKGAALLQAVTGVGLVKVFAGLAAGAGAVYAVDQAFAGVEKSAAASSKEMQAVTKAADEAAKAAAKPAKAAKEATDEAAKAAEAAARAQEEWIRKGEQLTSSVRTPVEILADKMGEFREALNKGVITAETFARLAAKAADEFDRADDAARKMQERAKPVAAAVFGTSAGDRAIDAARRQMESRNAEANAEKQEAARRDKLLSDLIDGVKSVEHAVRESQPTTRQHRI